MVTRGELEEGLDTSGFSELAYSTYIQERLGSNSPSPTLAVSSYRASNVQLAPEVVSNSCYGDSGDELCRLPGVAGTPPYFRPHEHLPTRQTGGRSNITRVPCNTLTLPAISGIYIVRFGV